MIINITILIYHNNNKIELHGYNIIRGQYQVTIVTNNTSFYGYPQVTLYINK